MTTLRNLNRAVQSAEFPSHEWAQAVREMLNEVAERMEPASEGAKVECPNCAGERLITTTVNGVTTTSIIRPEPAPPSEMPDSGAPDGTPYEIAEAVAKLSRHGEKQEAHNLAGWWMRLRTHAAQPKVAMTAELENQFDRLGAQLSCAKLCAQNSMSSTAEVCSEVAKAQETVEAIYFAVRAQAAGVKLPPVEAIRRLLIFGSWPTGDDESYFAQKKAVAWLAELDAAEGVETKEGK